MEFNDKNAKKDYISSYIDTSHARLKEYEIDFLYEFIENYDTQYKGESITLENSFTDFSSDGKYRRDEVTTFTFKDDVGIARHYAFHDDDGMSGENDSDIEDARGILNWFKEYGDQL